MRRFLRENGLSLVLFGLFIFLLIGQTLTGQMEYNDNARDHRQPVVSYVEYLGTGHFVEAVFENWESEFLQMAAYVVLTIFLFQKGSPESKKLDETEACDKEPDPNREGARWAVRQGGWILKLYSHSLSLALFLLFIISFFLHAAGGAREYSQDQIEHGEQAVTFFQYLGTSRFWFESFQNWQSEFLSIGMILVLSIFLREKGSPESKPVDHPHSETGSG